MTDLILSSLTAYIMACVIGASSLFEPMREYVKRKLPRLKIGNHKHFIECRLCLLGWISFFIILIDNKDISVVQWFSVWGLSYFLTSQER